MFQQYTKNGECFDEEGQAERERALPACKALLRDRSDDPNVHQRIGDIYYTLGQLSEAAQHLKRALDVREGKDGKDDLRVAMLHYNLAQVYESQGKDGEAEKELLTARSTYVKHHGARRGDVVDCLNFLGRIYAGHGRYDEAELMYRQELDIFEQAFGKIHSAVVPVLEHLAETNEDQGRYSEVEVSLKRILDIVSNSPKFEERHVADALNNLGRLCVLQGRYSEAEELHLRALRIREKALGREDSLVAQSLHNLGLVYSHLGRYSAAESKLVGSLSIYEKTKGVTHELVAGNLNSLGAVYYLDGRFDKARQKFERALEIWELILRPDHPLMTDTLANLATVLDVQGHQMEAARMYERSLAIREKHLGPDHPDVATSLTQIALTKLTKGYYSEAENLLLRALAIREKVLGPKHPENDQTLCQLARLAVLQEQPARAVALLERVVSLQESLLRTVVTETHLQSLLEMIGTDDRFIYGLALLFPERPDVQTLVLRVALLHKGRTLEMGAIVSKALRSASNHFSTNRKLQRLNDLRTRRESLFQRNEASAGQLRQLQEEVDQLEQELTQKVGLDNRTHFPQSNEIIQAVSRRIPSESVLLDIVLARAAGYRQAIAQAEQPHYLGLLLFPDQRVFTVDLGEAAVIDNDIQGFLSALQNPNADPHLLGQAVYKRILFPLLPHLAGIKHIQLSLDGTLNLVPFDALHDGSNYLLGRYRFHYLTSGRDLLREVSDRVPQPALILADPNFQAMPTTLNSANAMPAQVGQTVYGQLVNLPRLPGTLHEARRIQALLGVAPLLDDKAREEVVRSARGPWIMHIATHGLFFDDIDRPQIFYTDRGPSSLPLLNEFRAKNVAKVVDEPVLLPGGANAMNRSGLALAGVAQGHRAASAAQDGLLTAEEARGLDLDGTQLVVLSACETGKGVISVGQGVYGLRRGFLVAGAETLVTSLWRVHDEATGELMGIYYRKLLSSESPGDRVGAMQETMLELRARPGRAHPYYWAPFIVVGQDGPLRAPKAF